MHEMQKSSVPQGYCDYGDQNVNPVILFKSGQLSMLPCDTYYVIVSCHATTTYTIHILVW